MTRMMPIFLTAAILGLGATAVAAQPAGDNPSAAQRFRVHLDGAEEVPMRDTDAQGEFLAVLSPDGQTLAYKLIVANIRNVVASHIHLAPAGSNGGVVAFLFGSVPPAGGPANGVLAEGTITAADLVGAFAGQDLSVLVQALVSGGAYVNVHTNDGVAPNNTGPGDFASGEVRGQIRAIGR